MVDIKAKADEVLEKLRSDPSLMAKFQKDPVATVESLLGVNLPEAQIKQLADGVKAKIKLEDAGGMLGGLFGKK